MIAVQSYTSVISGLIQWEYGNNSQTQKRRCVTAASQLVDKRWQENKRYSIISKEQETPTNTKKVVSPALL